MSEKIPMPHIGLAFILIREEIKELKEENKYLYEVLENIANSSSYEHGGYSKDEIETSSIFKLVQYRVYVALKAKK